MPSRAPCRPCAASGAFGSTSMIFLASLHCLASAVQDSKGIDMTNRTGTVKSLNEGGGIGGVTPADGGMHVVADAIEIRRAASEHLVDRRRMQFKGDEGPARAAGHPRLRRPSQEQRTRPSHGIGRC